MNKIYKAFDSIKLDEEVKKKAAHRLETKQYKSNYSVRKLIYGAIGLVCTTTFILLFTDNYSPSKASNSEIELDAVDTMNVTKNVYDTILYDGYIYSLMVNYDAIPTTSGEKLGNLHGVDLSQRLTNDFDAYYHDGYEVYSSSDPMILIVKSNSELFVYKR